MSEEEILEKIEKIIKHFESQEYILNGQKIYEYIQGLFNLYNEEKDKNASLQKEIKLMKSININDNYISKDKIRKLKEYYEDSFKYAENEIESNNIYVSIKIFEKLLEEE